MIFAYIENDNVEVNQSSFCLSKRGNQNEYKLVELQFFPLIVMPKCYYRILLECQAFTAYWPETDGGQFALTVCLSYF